MNENELLNVIKTSPMLTNPLINIPLKMYFREQFEKKLKENDFPSKFDFAIHTKTDVSYDDISTFDYFWTDFLLFMSMKYPETSKLDELKKLANRYIQKTVDELVLERKLNDHQEKSFVEKAKADWLFLAFLKAKLIHAGLMAGLLLLCLVLNVPSTMGRITFSCVFAIVLMNSTYWKFLLKKFGKFDVDEMIKID